MGMLDREQSVRVGRDHVEECPVSSGIFQLDCTDYFHPSVDANAFAPRV